MNLYVYYQKNDPNKEPYGKFEAISQEDAVVIAAHIKQMTIDQFLVLFRVEEWKKNLKI